MNLRLLPRVARQGSASRAAVRMRPAGNVPQPAPMRQPAGGHAVLAEQIRSARSTNPSVEFWFDSHPRIHAPNTPALEAVACSLGHYGPSAAGSPELADQLTGVTTNPILIEEYDAMMRQRRRANAPRSAANRDTSYHTHIVSAAEAMGDLHGSSAGRYGWVSAQVSPAHTFNTRAIVEEGLRLAALAENVMVKVPGSLEGYLAIEQLVGNGVSVNGTLSFSLAQFETFALAVARGREQLSESDNRRVRTVVTHMTGRVGDAVRAFNGPATLDIRALRLAEAALARLGSDLVAEIEPRSTILLSSVRVDPTMTEQCLHLTATLDKPVAYTIKPDTYAALELVDTVGVFRPDPHLLDEVEFAGLNPTHELIRPLFNRSLPASQFWAIPQFLQTLAEASSSHLKLIGGVHAA